MPGDRRRHIHANCHTGLRDTTNGVGNRDRVGRCARGCSCWISERCVVQARGGTPAIYITRAAAPGSCGTPADDRAAAGAKVSAPAGARNQHGWLGDAEWSGRERAGVRVFHRYRVRSRNQPGELVRRELDTEAAGIEFHLERPAVT